ncbi:MAG: hypothetical protein NC095_01980 [Muribaculum sp.]|nr:hypothetical protein [Muribaculum sp.]
MIVKCRLIPEGICMNLFGTYWTRDTSWIDKYVINHEMIHTAQQKELLFIPFYLLYFIEYLLRLIQYRSHQKAYLNISFEREAYAKGHDLNYLKTRHPYEWINHIS